MRNCKKEEKKKICYLNFLVQTINLFGKPNRLLLSCAANFSSVKEIEDAYKFFSDEMVIYSSNNQDNWMQYSLYQINTNEEVKQSVIRFMQNLGIGLRDIEVTIDQKKVEADELPPFLDSKFKNIILQVYFAGARREAVFQ